MSAVSAGPPRKQYSAEEKIRIVLDGLRGDATIAELCRRGGIAQEIDAAAMTVYVTYQHYDADVTGLPAAIGILENADFVSLGGLVNF